MKTENDQNSQELRSRRDVLKNAGVFVVPTLSSFKIADLAVAASGQKFSDWQDRPQIE